MNGKAENSDKKAAIVGIVGRTNAGKSTLVNALVGEKVSIVSPVEQTTRNSVRGIVSDSRGQLVLIDTPGLHKAIGPLGKLLNGMARASSAETDILCVVFDASHAPQIEDEGWMARVAREKPDNCVFVLNQCDKSPVFETMYRDSWAANCASAGVEPKWLKVSAMTGDGLEALLDCLFGMAEVGPALFDDDIVTDYPRKLAIADVVREKLLSRLFQEVPHEIGVAVKDIYESKDQWEVSVVIYVNKQSQKGMVIGKGGQNLKFARKAAEPEL
ncbi:MAG: GTPase Era, partial [Kiritimatiellae bacterium]|nr:GTPase Era [Kiritimatiellia bacterium]